MKAALFFNVAHYALWPCPWIIVALASLIVFPDLESIHQTFSNISEDKLGHDLAYPAMLTFLPSGVLGLVVASLAAVYMSTISMLLNWGSSYIVNDFYKRFVRPEASERELVRAGKIATILMMISTAVVALNLNNAKQVFDFTLLFGAGAGLIFILRWFWWRVNAWSEISAMFISGFVAIYLNSPYSIIENEDWKFPLGIAITTALWLLVTFLTPPDDLETLKRFYIKINPEGRGWNRVVRELLENQRTKAKGSLTSGIKAMISGCVLVYSLLFMIGNLIYQNYLLAWIFLVTALVAGGYWVVRQ